MVKQRRLVQMTVAEIDEYLRQPHTATMATVGPDGLIHQVAMFYAYLDGELWVQTKTKAQKICNLRRDPRLSLHVESGIAYDELRGVNVAGRGEIVSDPKRMRHVMENLIDRYHGGWDESKSGFRDEVLSKRVAVRLVAERVVSWDHTKLPSGSSSVTPTTGRA